MPRQSRLLINGGYYHIVTRGNDRRKLFRYNRDYKFFLEIVTKYLKKFNVSIIHYCLMPNHLHLLMRAEQKEDLPKFMQAVLQVYAYYFRKKYSSVGFIFQNRYKSRHIDNDAYLIECARYIERNPLRANLTDNLFAYYWSSFLFYSKGSSDDIINLTNPLYVSLGQTDIERQNRYTERILEERPYEHIVDKEFRIR